MLSENSKLGVIALESFGKSILIICRDEFGQRVVLSLYNQPKVYTDRYVEFDGVKSTTESWRCLRDHQKSPQRMIYVNKCKDAKTFREFNKHCKDNRIKVYDDFDIATKYSIESGVKPGCWLYAINPTINLFYERMYNRHHKVFQVSRVKLIKDYNKIIPMKCLFYDIEAYIQTPIDTSKPFSETAKNRINPFFMVSAVVFTLNIEEYEKHVFLFNPNDKEREILKLPPIKEGVVRGCEDVIYNGEKVKLHIYETEFDMLTAFVDFNARTDPDTRSAYNGHGFDDAYWKIRMDLLNVDYSSLSLSKFLKPWLKVNNTFSAQAGSRTKSVFSCFGSYSIDLMILIKNIYGNLDSYSLKNVCKVFLNGEEKYDLSIPKMKLLFVEGSKESFQEIAKYCYIDTQRLKDLNDKLGIIEFNLAVSKLTCCPFVKVCNNGKSGLCESTLAIKGRLKNILLDRPTKKIENDSYTGATVITPKIGKHKKVACHDFSSLYPSIIQECNMCPTTYLENMEEAFDFGYSEDQLNIIKNEDGTIEGIFVKTLKDMSNFGLIPSALTELLAMRKAIRKVQKTLSGDDWKAKEAEQLAIKVICNSLYGVLGAKFGQLSFKQLAKCVTTRGRALLNVARSTVENNFNDGHIVTVKDENNNDVDVPMNFEVVYGDTDSVMIKNNHEMSTYVAHQVNLHIEKFMKDNNIFNWPHTLEFEKLWSTWLIVRKKGYCGMKSMAGNPNKEVFHTMGLQTKRRDCPKALQDFLKEVLQNILNDESNDKILHIIRKQLSKLSCREVFIKDLMCSKSIKRREDYANPDKIMQLTLAEKMKKRDGVIVNSGDRIPYVIVEPNFCDSKLVNKMRYSKENITMTSLGENPLYAYYHDIPYNAKYYQDMYLNIISKIYAVIKLPPRLYNQKALEYEANEVQKEFKRLTPPIKKLSISNKNMSRLGLIKIEPCVVCCTFENKRPKKTKSFYHSACQNEYKKIVSDLKAEVEESSEKYMSSTCSVCRENSTDYNYICTNINCVDQWTRLIHLKSMENLRKKFEKINSAFLL